MITFNTYCFILCRTRHVNRAAEAEDAVGRSGSHSGLYYSPPGTSYTIVEHKKRPISPEQVA